MKKIAIDKPAEFLKLIEENKNNYLYNDHPSDGIDLFTDELIELYGWHGIAFENITYRSIANFIEDNCEGTFVYHDHPMGFNAYAILDNLPQAQEQIKSFIIEQIKQNDLTTLDEDQKESIEFFKITL